VSLRADAALAGHPSHGSSALGAAEAPCRHPSGSKRPRNRVISASCSTYERSKARPAPRQAPSQEKLEAAQALLFVSCAVAVGAPAGDHGGAVTADTMAAGPWKRYLSGALGIGDGQCGSEGGEAEMCHPAAGGDNVDGLDGASLPTGTGGVLASLPPKRRPQRDDGRVRPGGSNEGGSSVHDGGSAGSSGEAPRPSTPSSPPTREKALAVAAAADGASPPLGGGVASKSLDKLPWVDSTSS